jgi:hypothetical protein
MAPFHAKTQPMLCSVKPKRAARKSASTAVNPENAPIPMA